MQVTAIRRLMSPVTDSRGAVLYAFPYLPGTETQWAGWNYFGAPSGGLRPRLGNVYLPEQFLRYLVDDSVRERANLLSFDFDHDPATLARARRVYDAPSFDLREFAARGGRILLWHGWADAALSAASSVAYYEGVERAVGGPDRVRTFFRLFLLPGVHHGGGGPGYTEFDALSALEDWEERGRVPDVLEACRALRGERRCRAIPAYASTAGGR